MGKQYDHLWPQVASFENLLLAWREAAKGKRSKASVASSSTIGRATCCNFATICVAAPTSPARTTASKSTNRSGD